MLGDSYFCGRYFSPVYKKNGINAGRTNGTNKPYDTHEYFTRDLRWIEVQRKQQIVCGQMVISFDELLKIGTCTIAKTNTDLRESATNSVHYATPFGHCE